jgi:peptidoglycan/LPS O-acetylase OafA/YrhL
MKSQIEFNDKDRHRTDIDGLRAIAIIAVVLFHYFPTLIPGGYVGVDVFFVISGYLITKIIFIKVEENNFSIIDFYSKRIKRIFPVLIIVIITIIIIGKFILFKDEYQSLKDNIFYSSIFLSNYGYYKESGYFDRSSDTKALLHLWSLSIEMQFYIIWPIVLVLLFRIKKYAIYAIYIILILSFIFCVYQTYVNPTLAFYNPLARGWELIIGGLVFLKEKIQTRKINLHLNNFKSIIGLAMILGSCLLLNKYSMFPGWAALIPTFGAFLILDSSNNCFFNKYIISKKIFISIGLISYSIYLWHWPLLVFARIYMSEIPPVSIRLILILVVVIISYLTYKYIEKPIGEKKFSNNIIYILIMLMILIGVYSALENNKQKSTIISSKVEFEDHFFKYRNQNTLSEFEKKFRHECNFYQVEKYYEGNPTLIPKDKIDNSCFNIKSNKQTVLLWGDSHAQMLNAGLTDDLPSNWQVLQIASSGCYPNVDYINDSESNYCVRSNWFATNFIKENKIDVVVIAQSSGHNLSIINYTVNKLLSFGVKKVIVMGPAPKWNDFLPRIIIRQLWDNIPLRTFTGVNKEVLTLNTELKRGFINSPQKVYVDTISIFCNSQGCLTSINEDIKEGLVSWDTGHLTEIASKYLASKILSKIIIENNK